MKKSLILITLMICTGLMTHAQNNKVVSAWNYLTNYQRDGESAELLKARESINLATEHESTIGNAKTWYYKGLVEMAIVGAEELKADSGNSLSEAANAFSKSLSLDKKKRHKDDNLQNLRALTAMIYNQGSEFYQAKDFKNAYTNFSQILDLRETISEYAKKAEPVDTASLQAAALSADQAGMDDEALGIYEKMYDLDIKEVYVFNGLTALYKKKGDAAKAKMMREEARKAFPDDKNMIIDELNELLAAGKTNEATSLIEEAITLDPENASLHFALGSAKDATKDYTAAKASYEKALELDPSYFDALYNLGAIFYNQAADLTKQMADLSLDEEAKYSQLQNDSKALFAQALPYFEKAHSTNATDRNTLIALKEIYAKTGNFDKSNEMKKLLGN